MSYQPFPSSAGPAAAPARGRRNPVLVIMGIVVAVAGIVGGLILLLSASSSTENSVKKLARAPAGCTTTLEFDGTGRFEVFFEREGRISGLGDDCGGGDRAFGRSSTDVPDQTLTLVGPDGDRVDIDDADGTSYDAGDFASAQIGTVQIDQKGEYELTVAPDDAGDTDYAIAIGKDPTANEGTLRIAGLAVLIGGVLVGALLLVLGLRRRSGTTPATGAPGSGWAYGATPAPPAWPPTAPAAPPYAGPPTSFGSPGAPVPGPGGAWVAEPTRVMPGSTPGGWSSPAQDEPVRPAPPPDPFSRPPGG